MKYWKVSLIALGLVCVGGLAGNAYGLPGIINTAVNPANGHTYYELEFSNWTDAETAAIALGGHLVTINDQDENDWVFANFAVDDPLWIGFNDIDQEGTWVWTSGETVNYTNWLQSPLQPDNSSGIEDVAEIYSANSPWPPGVWNDMPASWTSHNGIVEIVPELLNIAVDIRPGGEQNPVNLGSKGVLPVAIFGEEDFDVFDIDLSSLVLDGATPRQKGKSGKLGSFEDINDDGLIDLLLLFEISELGIDGSATELVLEGLLNDGTDLVGSDLIRIVPAGDVNGDGAVDGVDFGLWQAGEGDADGDGDVDGVDFGIWQANYGTTTGAEAMAIPEPATLGLLVIGGLAMLKRRK